MLQEVGNSRVAKSCTRWRHMGHLQKHYGNHASYGEAMHLQSNPKWLIFYALNTTVSISVSMQNEICMSLRSTYYFTLIRVDFDYELQALIILVDHGKSHDSFNFVFVICKCLF